MRKTIIAVLMVVVTAAVATGQDWSEWSLLYNAVMCGDWRELDELLAAGADPNTPDFAGWNSLLNNIIFRKNNYLQRDLNAMVRSLIDAGADVNVKDVTLGHAPLHHATSSRSLYDSTTSDVESLIAAGADVNARDKDGRTPLSHALQNSHLDIAQALIDAGADVNGVQFPLHKAVYSGNINITQAMIDAGADVNAKVEYSGRTPLHKAVYSGNINIAQVLIDAGADVNTKVEYSGNTPLHYAVIFGNINIAQALINAGADVNAKDDYGNTPLYYADDIVQLLIALEGK